MAEPTYPHIIDKPYVWWTERNRIGIAYLDSGSAIYPAGFAPSDPSTDAEWKYSGVTGRVYSPNEALTFRAHVIRKARKKDGLTGQVLSALQDQPEFPEEFHEALVSKVIQHGYERLGDPNMLKVAQYWEAKYLQKVREGMAFAAKDKVGGFKKVLGYF